VDDTPEKEPCRPKATPQKEETKRDIFGGEEWWREKVQPWEGQLKVASENYKIKEEKFLEESKTLIIRKFGSHQQFKSTILGMERLRKERARYEARLIEAKEALKRVSKDAEESGAEPEWVTGGSKLQRPASLKAEGITTDAYGRDEAWWRDKIFTRREQLEEAVENYEKAYEKYSKSIEELSPWRFGRLSLTQYQMFSCRLDAINSEMTGYEAQVAEASERLKKLLKEAEESKVNPDWVKQ
jgi:tetratricopeptide (TPR) repeat protein